MHDGSCKTAKHSRYQRLRRIGHHESACRNVVSQSRQSRHAFTVMELLVTFGAISTLASLLLPAIGSVREAARQLQCKNQLKQIGVALHNYHESNNCLPPGWQLDVSGTSAYGWAVPLLPYLEQRATYSQVDRSQLIEHPVNQAARGVSLNLFLCPSDIIEPTFTLFEENEPGEVTNPLVNLPTANYVGVFGTIEADDVIPAPPGDGAFYESKPVNFAQLTRGMSNTLIVGERTMAMAPSTWLGFDYAGEDAACRLVGSALTGPNCSECDECEFSSRHSGGTNFLWADGHVQLLPDSISRSVYQDMARRESKL